MSQGAKQHESSGLTLLPAQCSTHRTSCCASQTGDGFVATVAAVAIFLPVVSTAWGEVSEQCPGTSKPGVTWPRSVLNCTYEEVSVSASTPLKRRLPQSEPQRETSSSPLVPANNLCAPPLLTAGPSCFSPPQTLGTAHCRVCTTEQEGDTALHLALTMARLAVHPVLTRPSAHTTPPGDPVHTLWHLL